MPLSKKGAKLSDFSGQQGSSVVYVSKAQIENDYCISMAEGICIRQFPVYMASCFSKIYVLLAPRNVFDIFVCTTPWQCDQIFFLKNPPTFSKNKPVWIMFENCESKPILSLFLDKMCKFLDEKNRILEF